MLLRSLFNSSVNELETLKAEAVNAKNGYVSRNHSRLVLAPRAFCTPTDLMISGERAGGGGSVTAAAAVNTLSSLFVE